MRKVKNRTACALLIILAIVVGLGIFLFRLYRDGADWATFRANPTIYKDGVLDTGTITDRNGTILASAGDGIYRYADDPILRAACLHAVGDYGGNIGTGALTAFSDRLTGYNFINGLYSFSGKGKTLRLTLDGKLQSTAYQALNGRKGAVLVANYQTGEILCMVSAPSYDPNTSIDPESLDGVYLNRCISSTFPPGSIFKLVTAAAAIENISDLSSRSWTCTGQLQVGEDVVTCTGVHGEQGFETALANSCNCAFAQISQELGAETLAKYAADFGLTKAQTLNGITTAAGSFEQAPAGSVNLSWSGIGQYNDLICPYSFLRYVCAIAHGGSVQELTLLPNESSRKTQLVDSETAWKLTEMMRYNAQTTYGSDSRFPGLEICAKTGTAEIGTTDTPHAWFTGFLKNSNAPLAFIVLVENGGGGLTAAGSVANTVLQAAVNG